MEKNFSKSLRAWVVQLILNRLFPHPVISLKYENAYTLLIAVLLSARCTDRRVNEVTPQLFSLASTPQEMAKLPQSAIQETIRSCGLSPTKSKAIKHLSLILVDEHGGKVPAELEALKTLPGVGDKTASVVVAQAFNRPAFPVDTHIHRCAKRWKLSSGRHTKQTEKDLKALFPQTSWKKLHLQIIHYGRAYCPARNHRVIACPICNALETFQI